MQKLWNEFGYLCRMAARRYAWLTERDAAIDADDLRQIAFVGLCKAATTYSEERFSRRGRGCTSVTRLNALSGL